MTHHQPFDNSAFRRFLIGSSRPQTIIDPRLLDRSAAFIRSFVPLDISPPLDPSHDQQPSTHSQPQAQQLSQTEIDEAIIRINREFWEYPLPSTPSDFIVLPQSSTSDHSPATATLSMATSPPSMALSPTLLSPSVSPPARKDRHLPGARKRPSKPSVIPRDHLSVLRVDRQPPPEASTSVTPPAPNPSGRIPGPNRRYDRSLCKCRNPTKKFDRHWNTACKGNDCKDRFTCAEPGCGKTYISKDNMKRHFSKAHQRPAQQE